MAAGRPKSLMGTFDRNLDPKKRLTIPSAWRAVLGDFVYVMPDAERRCLQLVPRDVMDARLEKFQEAALSDPELNKALDDIGSVSEMLEFDVQGRIRINDELLAFANLKGSVVLKGSVRMATIWPAEEKPESLESRIAKYSAAAAKLKF